MGARVVRHVAFTSHCVISPSDIQTSTSPWVDADLEVRDGRAAADAANEAGVAATGEPE
jgi:hypothetical protein